MMTSERIPPLTPQGQGKPALPNINFAKAKLGSWLDRVVPPRDSDTLPYGMYICADGREVLFDRGYRPLWSRRPGGEIEPADPHEWIHFKRQIWFYNYGQKDKMARSKAALAEWRATIH
jgi:hypothetical protein